MHLAAAIMAAALLWSSAAVAADCNGAAPDTWLVGRWTASGGLQTLVISRDATGLVWTYDRLAGVRSDRWGDKVTASGAGHVEKADGCRAILKGIYTRYGGHGARGREPVGSPLEWKLLQTGPGEISAEGRGYGQETFSLHWTRDPSAPQ